VPFPEHVVIAGLDSPPLRCLSQVAHFSCVFSIPAS
jgi:hypothetical protein